MREIQLHLRGDSAADPVLDPLHTALPLVEAQQLRNFGRATERVNEFFVGHGVITHHVYFVVNTAFINNVFKVREC